MRTRRSFLTAAAVGAAVTAMSPLSRASEPSTIKAVAFDVFTIFDTSTLDGVIEVNFPGRGREIGALWKDKLFNYFFLRTIEKRYADCNAVAAESLRYVLSTKGLDPSRRVIESMVDAFSHLKIWSDSEDALRRMREAGLRLAYLSNLTEAQLRSSSQGAGIAPLFEHYLSSDRVQAFKPDPRAYAMAERAFGLRREDVLFAATGGWDYTGSKSFGMETFWVNRPGFKPETLGIEPDGMGSTLTELAAYAISRTNAA
ncbi:haloacid dehalogenase type II [Burkholderia gladioli]|uniref:haloacid dehalogenase type II n=2 Tax=Burkholderia gladioli TaxID=28095 RepID=UPI002547561D|nr:haloacid dehalogenase type II [Burkholderia gladioli]